MTHTWPPPNTESAPKRFAAELGGNIFQEFLVAPYAQIVQVSMPAAVWESVYWSWLSLKVSLQSLHGFEQAYLFATRADDLVYAMFIITWRYPDAFFSWLDSEYSIENLLHLAGIPLADITTAITREYA